jgi:hypothetical protein
MKTFRRLTVLCAILSTGMVGGAVAGPNGPGARPGIEGRAGPRGDRAARMQRLEAKILQRVQSLDATRYQTLLKLKEQRPRAYRHLMMKSGKAMRQAHIDDGVEQRFLRAIDLTVKMGELADGYHDLNPKGQKARHDKMLAVAAEMFELRQEGQRARLEAMEARLAKARQELADRQADKDRAVDAMVDRIVTPRGERGGAKRQR